MRHFRLLLVHAGGESLPLGSHSLRVKIALDESEVGLNDGALVSDPGSLGVLVELDVSSLEVLDVFLEHLFLVAVGGVGETELEVLENSLEEGGEITVDNVNSVRLVVVGLLGEVRGGNVDLEVLVGELDDSRVEEAQLEGLEVLVNEFDLLL